MKNSYFLKIFILCVALILSSCMSQAKETILQSLTITTKSGNEILYKVEIAATQKQMQRGLMYRKILPEDQGMLFEYRPKQEVSMWMKNTILSLDMLFINSNGNIIKIAKNTTPLSQRTIASDGVVLGVLELNAGQAEKHGMQVGDQVSHPIFDSH
jgi:uncharacterized protein